jgi:UDP-glucuronate decarboxylase
MSISDGRVVSNFIVQALKNEPITIYGDGNQSRSFCYVSDLVEGIYKLLIKKELVDSPINLGNPNEFTIKQLAEAIIKITNSQSKLINNPLPQDDPKQRRPNISLASELLKWQPTVQLEEGIGKTVAYFKTVI